MNRTLIVAVLALVAGIAHAQPASDFDRYKINKRCNALASFAGKTAEMRRGGMSRADAENETKWSTQGRTQELALTIIGRVYGAKKAPTPDAAYRDTVNDCRNNFAAYE